MVEQLLDNSENFVSVFEMGSKQIDVDDDVNEWHMRCQIYYFVAVWICISRL